jgi:hypothetical protein
MDRGPITGARVTSIGVHSKKAKWTAKALSLTKVAKFLKANSRETYMIV